MKIKGWTLVELIIALTIVTVISGICMSNYKPKAQSAKIYVYATIRNLMRGNTYLISRFDGSLGKIMPDDSLDTKDEYCMQLADIFTLDNYSCEKTGSNSNFFEFGNGSTIEGIANDWEKPYENAKFQFKNIVLDIDGKKGLNKVGYDRFPLRIYTGAGVEGAILPAPCGDADKFYDGNNPPKQPAASPYCNGTPFDFYTDDTILTYDVYSSKLFGSDDTTTTKKIMVAQPLSKADCSAYYGEGFFPQAHCDDYKIRKLHSLCDGRENVCHYLPHKPSSGMSFVLESVVGDLDSDF